MSSSLREICLCMRLVVEKMSEGRYNFALRSHLKFYEQHRQREATRYRSKLSCDLFTSSFFMCFRRRRSANPESISHEFSNIAFCPRIKLLNAPPSHSFSFHLLCVSRYSSYKDISKMPNQLLHESCSEAQCLICIVT